MQRIQAWPGGPLVSRLGFGCAPIMGRVSKQEALRAMAIAADLGVTHFDIARSYGFGDAEAILGEFAKGRVELTITSKFGVVPPRLELWQRVARPVIRAMRNRVDFLRKTIKSNSGNLLSERRYDRDYARACLETSLRNLGRDYIDFYLLHEPDPAQIKGLDELHGFFDQCMAEGKIGSWGVAFPATPDDVTASALGSVMQFSSQLQLGEITNSQSRLDERFRFVTQPLAGGGNFGATPLIQVLAGRLACTWQEAAFAWAGFQAGAKGAVIGGMFDPTHIRGNVTAMKQYLDNRLATDVVIREVMREPFNA